MDFSFTEEQELLRAMVREFARTEIAPIIRRHDEKMEFPRELFRKMGELGFLGIVIPESYGGAGLTYVDYMIIMEEISRVDGSTGLGVAAHNSLGTNHIFLCGSEEQKRKYVPRLASGEWIAGWALTEPGSGSDAVAMRCSARKDGDGWILDGTKNFCTHGGIGDVVVVLAVSDRTQGNRGISAFAVERGTPGFRSSKKEDKLGCRSSDTAEIVLENCRVPGSALLGREGEGYVDALRVLAGGRVSIAALGMGIAVGAFHEALAYSRLRTTFGKPLCEHQAIQMHLANMWKEVEASRLLCYRVAWMRDQGMAPILEASMAKLYSSEVAVRVCDLAVQIHGAYGYTKDYPVERLYRDAKICTIGEGTSEIQRMVISRAILQQAAAAVPAAGGTGA